MIMSFWIAVGICFVALAAIAVLARTSAAAHAVFALPMLLLALPWLVQASPVHRVFVAFLAGILFMSAADFALGRRPPTFGGRLGYIVAFAALIDATTLEKVPRYLDRRAIGRIVAAVFTAALAVFFWSAAAATPPAVRVVVRVLSAAAVILAVADASNDLVRVLSGLFGARFADVHLHPYRSTSLSDFWSRRWNRTAARWFRQHAFIPARGAGVTAGVFALFAVSGVMHAYLVAAVNAMPGMVALFFLAQAALLLAERRMRVRRWPRLAGRTWTIASLATLLPLLLIPLGFSL
jgi:hypothetical protein